MLSPQEIVAAKTNPKVQEGLARHRNVRVRIALASNVNITEEVSLRLADDKSRGVVRALAANPNIDVHAEVAIIKRRPR